MTKIELNRLMERTAPFQAEAHIGRTHTVVGVVNIAYKDIREINRVDDGDGGEDGVMINLEKEANCWNIEKQEYQTEMIKETVFILTPYKTAVRWWENWKLKLEQAKEETEKCTLCGYEAGEDPYPYHDSQVICHNCAEFLITD